MIDVFKLNVLTKTFSLLYESLQSEVHTTSCVLTHEINKTCRSNNFWHTELFCHSDFV